MIEHLPASASPAAVYQIQVRTAAQPRLPRPSPAMAPPKAALDFVDFVNASPTRKLYITYSATTARSI